MRREKKLAASAVREVTAISALTSAVSVGAVVAARRRRLISAAIATVVQMAMTLVYWEQMVRYFDRQRALGESHARRTGNS